MKYKVSNFFVSKEIPSNEKMDVFIVSVGTPLAEELPKKPNIEILDNAIDIFKNLLFEKQAKKYM